MWESIYHSAWKKKVNPKRVLLINSDPFELATLSASLRLHGVNVVGEASNIFLAENLHRSLQPEVVLVELQSPGEETIGFINKARKINPKLGIIIMTVCPDLRLIGLQEKNIPHGSKIILKRTLSDLSIVTTTVASLATDTDSLRVTWVDNHAAIHENSSFNKVRQLTDVQIETLRLLAQGLSNSEIARVRFVSEKSVEQVVARIAKHFLISPERSRNSRVILTGEYFKWLGASQI